MNTQEFLYKDIEKFNPEVWITYSAVGVVGTYLTNKIKNIPDWQIVVRFWLVPEDMANLYEKYWSNTNE